MFTHCVFSGGWNNVVETVFSLQTLSLSVSAAGWWSCPLSTTWAIYRRVTAKSCWWSWGRIWSLMLTSSRGRCWTSTPGHTETLTEAQRLTISRAPRCVSSNESGAEKERVLPSDLPPCKYSTRKVCTLVFFFWFCFLYEVILWWQWHCNWIFKLPLVQCSYSLLEFYIVKLIILKAQCVN